MGHLFGARDRGRTGTLLSLRGILSPLCLPISPPGRKKRKAGSFPFSPYWSGRRVSNSRPQPWQGCALPTELLPRCWRREPESNRPTRICNPTSALESVGTARILWDSEGKGNCTGSVIRLTAGALNVSSEHILKTQRGEGGESLTKKKIPKLAPEKIWLTVRSPGGRPQGSLPPPTPEKKNPDHRGRGFADRAFNFERRL
jgi:hypothetical protein